MRMKRKKAAKTAAKRMMRIIDQLITSFLGVFTSMEEIPRHSTQLE
jgi:hypothetical protein